MPVTAAIATPPPVVDVHLELLHETGDGWHAVPQDGRLRVGARIGANCQNRGPHTVLAAVLVRDMSGALRAPVGRVWEVDAGEGVRLGVGPEPLTVLDGDIELVVALSHDETPLQELLRTRREGVEGEAITHLALPYEVRLDDVEPQDDDYLLLATRAVTGRSSGLTVLEALTLVPLPMETYRRVAGYVRRALLDVGGAQRARLVEIAVNLEDAATREHVRALAADDTDPDRAVAIRALAEIGDEAAGEELLAMVRGGGIAREDALRWLAAQTVVSAADIAEDPVDDPAGFWVAVIAARAGQISLLDEVLSNHGSAAARRVVLDPWCRLFALRELRPLPEHVCAYLTTRVNDGPSLAPAMHAFVEALIRPPEPVRDLTDGIRPVPSRLTPSIRANLRSVGGLTELRSFETPYNQYWRSVESMDRARRGVLLAELLEQAIVLHRGQAVDLVASLVERWSAYQWFPDVEGVFRAGALLSLTDDTWGLRLVTQQLSWVVSRAPFTTVLRHVMSRLARGAATDADLEIFRGVLLTRHDPAPPPRGVALRHLPRAARGQSTAPGSRSWRARAWLETERRGPNGLTAIVGFELELQDGDLAITPPSMPEAARDLTVVLQVDGGRVQRSVATAVLTPDGHADPLMFEVSAHSNRLSLQFLVYDPDAGVLLLELAGAVEIGAAGLRRSDAA